MNIIRNSFLSAEQRRLIPQTPSATASPQPSQQTANLPQALPTENYYVLFPHRVGFIGNVHITDEDEFRLWMLVGRPVTRQDAEKAGGCVIFSPSKVHPAPGSNTTTTTTLQMPSRYYRITDSDDVVYGRAAYTPLPTTGVEVALEADVYTASTAMVECELTRYSTGEDESEEEEWEEAVEGDGSTYGARGFSSDAKARRGGGVFCDRTTNLFGAG